MGVNRIDLLQFAAPSANEVHWHYLPLRDIQILGDPATPTVRLHLEEDECGVLHTIYCKSAALHPLEPYTQQLNAWHTDPYSSDIPLLPVVFDADGRPTFCTEGAYHDHPELGAPRRRQRIRVQLPPQVSDQMQTVVKSLGMTTGEAVLSMILKTTTRIG